MIWIVPKSNIITFVEIPYYLLSLTSMMLYLLTSKFKISTGAIQMSAATCLKSGSDIDLTFKLLGKLKLPYIKNNIDHDWHSSTIEAANVTHPESGNLCDNIAYNKERNKFQTNLQLGKKTCYCKSSGKSD